MQSLDFTPIGFISSCYKEKFAIPRQPGLVNAAKSELILEGIFNKESIRGLEDFSHIWLQFIFHETEPQGWKPMVRPPRLGGNKKVGVFATRSTFRPNPIGLSVVELDRVEIRGASLVLHLIGADLIDGTPVRDIKPYLPYVDSIPDAKGGFAKERPGIPVEVCFSKECQMQCEKLSDELGENIEILIKQILELDPRPSYQRNNTDSDRIYSVKLYDFDLKWQYCENNKIKVLSVN